jgi:hypothetical protein
MGSFQNVLISELHISGLSRLGLAEQFFELW